MECLCSGRLSILVCLDDRSACNGGASNGQDDREDLGADLRVSSSRNHFGYFEVVDFDRVIE